MSPKKKVKSPKETNTKKIRISDLLFVSDNTMKILKALFVPNNKGNAVRFQQWYLSNNTMKTLATKKSIICSELTYV
ncbi:hypothetical protein pdam_00018694 [Pocillopora damicornis]|uniref:Uncharacterized protein n=1 Tax=Pocillopora damicornis TaxID=46731 RepID=A0A3M6UI87_POCDA|nr:hypothetical protein pdam_00018694 [Pocillopora damicornis]